MIAVKIYTGDEFAGEITYDGDGTRFHITPHDSGLLRRILSEPVWMRGKRGLDTVYAYDDPERFRAGLSHHYKSGQGISATAPYDPDAEK